MCTSEDQIMYTYKEDQNARIFNNKYFYEEHMKN